MSKKGSALFFSETNRQIYCLRWDFERYEKHSGTEYKCVYNECNYKTTIKKSFNKHVDYEHLNRPKLSCEYENCTFQTKTSLRRHVESIHLGIKYPCEHCSYKATNKGHLKRHFKSFHK